MSVADHVPGVRAIADPVLDITDMYAFPSPERPGVLVLILNEYDVTCRFSLPDDEPGDGPLHVRGEHPGHPAGGSRGARPRPYMPIKEEEQE